MLKRVLYIEDSPEQLALVQALIERAVPETIVDVSATSAGAEVFLNRECYDLVISDLKLPGELGTTIIERVLERDSEQPVLLLTAYGWEWGAPDENFIRGEIDRIAERFQRPVPMLKKFDETSPAEFLMKVNDLLNERFCKHRQECEEPTRRPHPPARLRLLSECVRAARRAVAA